MNVEFVNPPAAHVSLLTETYMIPEVLATLVKGFNHDFSGALGEIASSDMQDAVDELQKTSLQGPLEMIHYVFLLQNVSRAFTHQLVRYRIGTSFLQESLRFSEKREAKVLVPEHLTGYDRALFEHSAMNSFDTYWFLLDKGVSAEDARGVLPIHTLTSIYMDVSLRTLINIYRQRMCLQAQAEWKGVLEGIKANLDGYVGSMLKMSCETAHPFCMFASKYDRPCPIREAKGL